MNLPTNELLQNEYQLRLNRVIDYIMDHYDEKLTLDKISEVACISKFHFHRLFHAMVGETLNHFIQRVRLEKSVYNLIHNMDKSILEIALDCGFYSSQNYARAFKAHYGIVPSDVRNQFNWEIFKIKINDLGKKKKSQLHPVEAYFRDRYYDKHHLSFEKILKQQIVLQVEIKNIPDMRVAYIRRRGAYTWSNTEPSFIKLYKWANPRELITRNSTILDAIRNNPNITPENNLIHDACITIPDSIKDDKWVNIQTLPGGKYAVYHCGVTDVDHIEEAWIHLINWLIFSDYQPDDRPLYMIHCNDFVTTPLKRPELDICFPVRPLYE